MVITYELPLVSLYLTSKEPELCNFLKHFGVQILVAEGLFKKNLIFIFSRALACLLAVCCINT